MDFELNVSLVKMFPMKQPFTAIVSGPTKAGKSVWVKNLIMHADSMISPSPEQIFYCYTEWQPLYQGLPDMQQLKSDAKTPEIIDIG